MSAAVAPTEYQYLKPRQVEEMEQETRAIDRSLADPNSGADRADAARRKRQIQHRLNTQRAPELTPEQRDVWAKRAKELEAKLVDGMPSGEEMRKNPPGAVDKNLAWHRRTRFAQAEWKNIQRALSGGDPNAANIERLRRHTTPGDLSMVGAQIPGTQYFGTNPSPQYKEGWERTFGADTPADAEASLEVQAEAKPERKKPPYVPTIVRAACGAEKDKRGVKQHEKHCSACQAALASGEVSA